MKYVNNDFYFSDDGDFILSANKDFQDTISSPYRSLAQEIKTRLDRSLDDFLGKQNTLDTGNKIKLRVITELTKYSLVATSDLNVDVIPTGKESVLIKIFIKSGNKITVFNHKFSTREKSFGNKGKV